jgi:hypothetical protein
LQKNFKKACNLNACTYSITIKKGAIWQQDQKQTQEGDQRYRRHHQTINMAWRSQAL